MRHYRNYTNEQLFEAVRSSKNMAGVLKTLDLKAGGGNYTVLKSNLKKFNLDTSHWKSRDWIEKIKWKEWELEAIRNNHDKMTDRELQKKHLPHRSSQEVERKRRELKLYRKMQKHQIWTDEEVAILKKVWKDYNQKEISDKFITTKTPIQINRKRIRLGFKKPPVWTTEERGLLFEHGANYDYRALKKMYFPNKSLNQIAQMRRHLGIKRRK